MNKIPKEQICTIRLNIEDDQRRDGVNSIMKEKNRRTRREEAGEKKDKCWSRQGKGKYKTIKKRWNWKKSVHIVIWDKGSVYCRKDVSWLSLNSVLIFAHQQACSLNHRFVERAANGPSIHPWNSFWRPDME